MSVNEKMTALADSVRDLRGTTEKLGIDQMREEVGAAKGDIDAALSALSEKGVELPENASSADIAGAITNIGSDPRLAQMVERTLETLVDDTIEKVGEYAFYQNTSSVIKTVNLPNAKAVGYQAFYLCRQLTEVKLPNVERIDTYAFQGCTAISELNFPRLATCGGNAFNGCTGIVSINMPMLDTDASSLFSGCTSLKTIALPAMTVCGTGLFSGCTSLETAYLPLATTLKGNVFSGCTSLKSFEGASVTSIEFAAFRNCTSLTEIILPKGSFSGSVSNCFSGCAALKKVVLGRCYLPESNLFSDCANLETLVLKTTDVGYVSSTALEGTLIGAGNGYVYVPAEAVDTFKNSSYWSKYANQIRAIEDYPEICGV